MFQLVKHILYVNMKVSISHKYNVFSVPFKMAAVNFVWNRQLYTGTEADDPKIQHYHVIALAVGVLMHKVFKARVSALWKFVCILLRLI